MYIFVVNGNHLKLHNEHNGKGISRSLEAHNLHLGPLELNIYAPPSRTKMTIFVTCNVIIGRDTFQAHSTPKIICGVGTWKCMLLIGSHTMSNILSSTHLWLGKQENLHMFKKSNSGDLYFLGRETYTKEIANLFLVFLECWNCYKFWSGKGY